MSGSFGFGGVTIGKNPRRWPIDPLDDILSFFKFHFLPQVKRNMPVYLGPQVSH